jgi:hypothetical protein
LVYGNKGGGYTLPEFMSSQYSTTARKWIGIKDIEPISEVVFVRKPGRWTPKGT